MKPEADPRFSLLIFIDGHCVLCSGVAKLLIRLDRDKIFLFGSLQGDYAKTHLPEVLQKKVSSIVVQSNTKFFTESDAILQIVSRLRWPLSLFRFLSILPKCFRDFLYRQVAKYRYPVFGKLESCPIPRAVDKTRLMDGF